MEDGQVRAQMFEGDQATLVSQSPWIPIDIAWLGGKYGAGSLMLLPGLSRLGWPSRILGLAAAVSHSSRYCGGDFPTRRMTRGYVTVGIALSIRSTRIW